MMSSELPPDGHADVRIVASDPGTARQVAEILRRCFAATEQRSYPIGTGNGGTRLHLTVDTRRTAGPARSWLATSRSSEDERTQTEET